MCVYVYVYVCGIHSVTKVLLVSGKLYYELVKERQARKAHHVALVRLEVRVICGMSPSVGGWIDVGCLVV